MANIKENTKTRVTGILWRNPPVTGWFSTQRDSNAESIGMWNVIISSPSQHVCANTGVLFSLAFIFDIANEHNSASIHGKINKKEPVDDTKKIGPT